MPDRLRGRDRRRRRIRKRIQGVSERPRLAVFRSNKHIYVQVIDDFKGSTLAAASSAAATADGKKTDVAKAVGGVIAAACLEQGIKRVVFDRAGYIYHGRIRALADGAREGGLEF